MTDTSNDRNSMVLDPDQILVGMTVALYGGITAELMPVRRSIFAVKAIQLPFVALGWLDSELSWLIDTRETVLVEMNPEMVTAMRRS